jgi:hypothetical protein
MSGICCCAADRPICCVGILDLVGTTSQRRKDSNSPRLAVDGHAHVGLLVGALLRGGGEGRFQGAEDDVPAERSSRGPGHQPAATIPRPIDILERKPMQCFIHSQAYHFNPALVQQSFQHTAEISLVTQRNTQFELHVLPGEARVVSRLDQRTIEPR